MAEIIEHVEQGSDEWLKMRCGVVSSSNFHRVITPAGKRSGDNNFKGELAIERITGRPYNNFVSYDMRRGTELQPEATALYEFLQGVVVKEIGFCFLDGTKKVGASTDGLIEDEGVFEGKAPKGLTHIKYLEENKLPDQYKPQVQGEIYVTEREWCDFMSYFPGLKPLIIRVYRDEKYIKLMAQFIKDFVEELDEYTERIRSANVQ